MQYHLFRVPTLDSTLADGAWLGRFNSIYAALRARDGDAAAVLANPRPAADTVVCYQIVGHDETA